MSWYDMADAHLQYVKDDRAQFTDYRVIYRVHRRDDYAYLGDVVCSDDKRWRPRVTGEDLVRTQSYRTRWEAAVATWPKK